MASDQALDHYAVTVVSCDILGHSSATDRDQVARVAAINEIVASTIAACPPGDVVWSSGGDGGHVVFRQHAWQQPAVQLILDLYRWSESANVPLRITGHRGDVAHIRGADGRVQMVGDGINYAGWLLTQVSREGVVVSNSFHREIEVAAVDPIVEFHDPRTIPNLDFEPQLLLLMSWPGMRSSWVESAPGDHAALELAVHQNMGWEVLYRAKRIWQVNSEDQDVARALEGVRPHHLRYRDSQSLTEEINPFFGNFGPDELKEVLRLGELVERRRGDVICRHGEAGDTMFVILRGQVGVYHSEGEDFHGSAAPKYVQREGEIVGELAYALARNRTADLLALTDVALLSFNNEDLRSRLSDTPVGVAASRQISTFINYRVLQHVSDNAAYLLGPRRAGPLAVGPGSWEYALAVLRRHCELITVDTRALDLTLDALPMPQSRHRGLYILAAGTLRSETNGAALLQGSDFPILWMDIPNLLPSEPHVYRVQDEPVKVLRIAAEGIDELSARQREALRTMLPRAINRRLEKYEFDVFISHSSADLAVVLQIYDRMTEAGIRCWLDDKQLRPGMSVTETIENGLRSSRFLLACVSDNFAHSSWAQREFRAMLHQDIKRRDGNFVIVLMLDENVQESDVVPLLAGDVKRVSYEKGREFNNLIDYILSR